MKNLFATVLTYAAPTANYGGETELNRRVMQKITDGRGDYPIISPEAMRNALREILTGYDKKTVNRERIHPVSGKGKSEEGGEEEKQQLAVRFSKYPDPDVYIDDFFFGYLLAVKGKELTKLRTEKKDKYPMKRDSILRMNLAKGLEQYRHNNVFTQSPKLAEGNPWVPGGGETAAKSGLLHRETAVTAFQYPFALSGNDCSKAKPEWTKTLLKAIGELNGVAGNHARSYFEMAPASVVVRLTDSLVAGYRTYCFKSDGKLPDLIDDVLKGDYPASEFYFGGELVKRDLPESTQTELKAKGVTLERDPRKLLDIVADKFTSQFGKEK